MKDKKRGYIMKKALIIGSIGALVTLLTACFDKDAASIGIIGGSDGPTSIYIKSNINRGSILGIVAIVGAIFWLMKKK